MTEPAAPRLLLLRHGQISANRQGRWHGSTDSPLTWRGRRQANRTARHLLRLEPCVGAIYSSPLQRCRATAAVVARRLGIAVQVDEGLREYAIGEWENMRFGDLARQHRFVDLATTDHDFAPPGGETLRQVAERVVGSIDAIRARHDAEERVLIVGHGAAMAVALSVMIDTDAGAWMNYRFDNCSLTELVLSPVPYLSFFNATHHL